jgi:peroxiredoxin
MACLLVISALALASGKVPRKSPEFKIQEPSGTQVRLSSFRGKVVVLAFVRTTCPHCQHFSQVLSKLYRELGPQGFQPVAVAFSDGNSSSEVGNFVRQFGIDFPVGCSATSETVHRFLGASDTERLMVPQVVVIDRTGVIRAQSPAGGDPDLQDDVKLRKLVQDLLAEH